LDTFEDLPKRCLTADAQRQVVQPHVNLRPSQTIDEKVASESQIANGETDVMDAKCQRFRSRSEPPDWGGDAAAEKPGGWMSRSDRR
jgi:hypothetical protein